MKKESGRPNVISASIRIIFFGKISHNLYLLTHDIKKKF